MNNTGVLDLKTRKMPQQSILFVGAESSDKITMIKKISGSRKLTKTSNIQLIIDDTPPNAVLPLNYAAIELESGENVHLIEVQHIFQMNLLKRYWSKKSFGVILLIDFLSLEPLDEMEKLLIDLSPYSKGMSLSVGVLNNDTSTHLKLIDVNKRLNRLKYNAAVFDLDINSEQDISLLLQSMLISNMLGVTSHVS